MNGELLRIVDSIHRDKDIDKEIILQGIESALRKAAKKKYDIQDDEEIEIRIDRETGNIIARSEDREIDPIELGRIAAQAAKQVIIQKIKEAEQDVIYQDFEDRKGELVHGHVVRVEGRNIVLNISKAEAVLPKKEQVPEERWKVGDRLRAVILDVKKAGQKVKIILSRSHPELVKRLFEIEVPEISDGIIVLRSLVREAGYRTKVAVTSSDPKVDPVGACVGVRGSRIKSIIDELNGEKIDIIRWSDNPETLIANALKPAKVESIVLDEAMAKATVIVAEDQLSLAIGKKGQNVRLASRLANWEIDILTAEEVSERTEHAVAEFMCIPGITEEEAGSLSDFGYHSLEDILSRGAQFLTSVEGFDLPRAEHILSFISKLDLASLSRESDKAEAGKQEACAGDGAVDEKGAPGGEAQAGGIPGDKAGGADATGGGTPDDAAVTGGEEHAEEGKEAGDADAAGDGTEEGASGSNGGKHAEKVEETESGEKPQS